MPCPIIGGMKRNLFAIAGLFTLFLAAFSNVPPAFGVTLPSGVAVFETSLQDRISSTDSSMSIVSATTRGSGTLSGYQCFTVDEGRTDAEYICGTLSGTTVSTLERGLDPLTGTTTVSALKFAHRKGADVKITDFPLIMRLRNQLAGVETFATLLNYAAATACAGTEPNWTICDKAYTDSRVSAGAANSNETTKGLVELATQVEMASSTSLGSTLASVILQAKYSTSSPYAAGLWNVITQNNGKIAQSFLDLTQAYTVSGLWTFFGATTTIGSATTTLATTTTAVVGIGTSTPMSGVPGIVNALNLYTKGGVGIGAATTSPGNLVVANLASTTSLVVSGTCTNCATNGYETITNTGAGPTTGASTATVTASCTGSKKVVGGGGSDPNALVVLQSSNPSGANSWVVVFEDTSNTSANTMTAYAICVNP